MHINACRIDAFGCLQGRTFEDLDHPLIVVQGPNEAGKTTLAAFLETMLYGFEPVEADRHPYDPHAQPGRLQGAVAYRSAGGAARTVQRRLRRIPEARLTETAGGEAVDLHNHPLPVVAHLPREVFASVYAPRPGAEATLRGGAWGQIWERLLRTPEADFLHTPASVIDEVEQEAARLWQPAPEGDARAHRLQEQRRALREALGEAKENDQKLRAFHAAVARHKRTLDALEEERRTLKARLRQAQRLRPIHALITRMETHEERAGDLAPYADLSDEPGPAWQRLARQIERCEAECAENEAARAEAQGLLDAFTEEDRAVLDEGDAIRAWTGRAAAHESRAEHHEALARDIEQHTTALEERAGRLFTQPWDEDLAPTVRALPEDELRERTRAYQEAHGEVKALQLRADTLALKVDRRKRLWPWAAAAALGGASYLAGVLLGYPLLWGPGAGLLVAALLQVFTVWSYNRERTERLGELDLEIEEREEERAEKSAAIAELLHEWPLPEEEAAQPDRDLVAQLRDFKRQLGERDALQKQSQALRQALDEAEDDLDALAARCGCDRPGEEALPKAAAALERRRATAEQHRDAAAEAETRLQALRTEQARLEQDLDERRERQEEFEHHLRALSEAVGEGGIEAGVEELNARRRAARQARHARAALSRRYPNWEDAREEIRAHEEDAGAWTYTDEEVVWMEERREKVDAEVVEEEKARARRRREVQQRSRRPTPAAVESEIADVERRLGEAQRRRDRLMLLAGVLRKAEHRFRLQHQPGVLVQASRFLRQITGGRYQRLALEDGQHRLQVYRRAAHAEQPVAAPLSRSLRAQAHLAFRFALVDHLDRAQEPLPVFLDEAFVGWDRAHRREGYRLLGELTRRRQVFVFTCHETLAHELQRRSEARVLALDAPPEAEPQAGAEPQPEAGA